MPAKPKSHLSVAPPPTTPQNGNIRLKLGEAEGYVIRLKELPKLPFKAAYALMRILEELSREAKRCTEAELEVYKELGEKKVGDDGIERHIVADDLKKELVKRILEIRDTDIELSRLPVPGAYLLECKIDVEPSKLAGLHIFFSEPPEASASTTQKE